MWWLVLYLVIGTLVMMKAGASLRGDSTNDTMINAAVRLISIIAWPIMMTAALAMTINDVRNKEEELK